MQTVALMRQFNSNLRANNHNNKHKRRQEQQELITYIHVSSLWNHNCVTRKFLTISLSVSLAHNTSLRREHHCANPRYLSARKSRIQR